MSKTDRSLEDALVLTPEVLSFVNNEKPTKVKQAPKKKEKSFKAKPLNQPTPKPKVKKTPAPVQLVPFSTRLPKELVNRLTLCATKRKLEEKLHCTHQEIANQAFTDWLNKHE